MTQSEAVDSEAMDKAPSCRYCHETIQPGARRCPWCLSWQSRWGGDAKNPLAELLLLAGGTVLICTLLVVWMVMGGKQEGGTEGPDPVTQIRVGEPVIVTHEEDCNRYLAVVGEVENLADAAWRNVYFQVRLLDAEGALIESFNTREWALVLPPRGSGSFKLVNREPLADLDEYAACEVTVRWAAPLPR